MRRLAALLLLALGLAVPHAINGAAPAARAGTPLGAVLRPPLAFEADGANRFIARLPGAALSLSPSGAALFLAAGAPASASPSPLRTHAVQLQPEHANPHPTLIGLDPLPGHANALVGNDPRRWRLDTPTYARVEYRGVYAGIDLLFHGETGRLEYDWIVRPGADPGRIGLRLSGARLAMRRDGTLVAGAGAVELRQGAPSVYQMLGGRREVVAARVVQRGRDTIGFALARYDRRLPLVIDPALTYATELGGKEYDWGHAVTTDAAGNIYVTGETLSPDFPTRHPLPLYRPAGQLKAYVTKLNPAGDTIIYSTLLGGEGGDEGQGIAVDGAGQAVVAGRTSSYHFPILRAVQTRKGAQDDAFVAKLNAAGDGLIYSTYAGGSGSDGASAVAVDPAGDALVTGTTWSPDFPAVHAFQAHLGGGRCRAGGYGLVRCPDAFVLKLPPLGDTIVYSTYLGGAGEDSGSGIATDAAGDAYVVGTTRSASFPTAHPLQPHLGGGTCIDFGPAPCEDAFVARLDSSGALLYSTYLGGKGDDWGSAIAVDRNGDAFVAGLTTSSNFPTAHAAQARLRTRPCPRACSPPLWSNAFIARLDPSGGSLRYSTYLGAPGGAWAQGIAVDASGDAFVTGSTGASGFPTVHGLPAKKVEGFVTEVAPSGSSFPFSTLLAGSGEGITLDPAGNLYVAGTSQSRAIPSKGGLPAPAKTYQSVAFLLRFGGRVLLGPPALPTPTLVAPPVTPTPTAVTPGAGPLRTDTAVQGVHLTLSVPRGTEPRGALIRVNVTLRNASARTIQLVPAYCGALNPAVEVMDSAGAPLYPPAFKHGPIAPSCGPFRLPSPVPAGHSVKASLYAILRANTVRATADVIIGGLDTRIEGKPVTLQLLAPDRPRVDLHTGPTVYADLAPAAAPHGSLTVIQWWSCRGRPGGFSLAATVGWYWQTVSGSRLIPQFDAGCSAQREWHAIAGWLNQSVGRIDYVHH